MNLFIYIHLFFENFHNPNAFKNSSKNHTKIGLCSTHHARGMNDGCTLAWAMWTNGRGGASMEVTEKVKWTFRL